MKRRYLWVAGLAAFVLSLLLHAPAATLYGWFAPKNPPAAVGISGLRGTVFSGKAGALVYQGRPALSELSWSLRPLDLLLGRLAYHVETQDPQLLLDGHVASGLGGTRISDLKLGGGVRALLTAIGQPYLPVDGQTGLDLKFLKLRQGWPVDADGNVRLIGLAWTLARDPVPLGDFEATVNKDKDDLVVLVSTLSGPIELNGDGRARPDRSYELHLQLKPKPDAPPMVMNLVRSLGPADSQGYHHIRRQGQAPPPQAPQAAP